MTLNYPYENLLIKIVEVLANGIGTGVKPAIIRWEARQKALGDADSRQIERLAQEKLRQTVRDVRAGKLSITDDLKLLECDTTSVGLSETQIAQIQQRYIEVLHAANLPPHQLVEIERQINLDQIGVIAMDEAVASGEAPRNTDPIDPDWFAQWRNRAQDIANEDMQRLWAKVLNNTAISSGSFSIHAMDFLSRMSRGDAELIATMGSFTFNGEIVFADRSTKYMEAKLPFGKLLYLDELGILSGATSMKGQLTIDNEFLEQPDGTRAALVKCGSKALICLPRPGVISFEIPGYPLTSVGKQILSLATVNHDEDSLQALAVYLRPKCSKIAVGNIDRREAGFTHLNDTQVLWELEQHPAS